MESPNYHLRITLDAIDHPNLKGLTFACPVRMDRDTRWPYRLECAVTVPGPTTTGTPHVVTASGVGATPMEAVADLITDLITLSKTQAKP